MNSPRADHDPGRPRVIVDRTLCVGTGMCTSIAPDLFELDDNGVLVLHEERITARAREEIDDAIACCPVEALSRVPD